MELSIEVSGSPKVMTQRIKDIAQKQCCLPILCPACASNQKLIIIGQDYRLRWTRAELSAQDLPMGFWQKAGILNWLFEKLLKSAN
jgi:hypothetical protein